MKKTILIIFSLLLFYHSKSQLCYDSTTFLKSKQPQIIGNPSKEFLEYANAFLDFSKKSNFSLIDTNCKGLVRIKNLITKLDTGFQVKLFSKYNRVYSIDSYCKLGEMNINFGILEIYFNTDSDARRAYNIFKKSPFKYYDKILRIFYPLYFPKRLLIFHTATPEDDNLRKFFNQNNIKNFIL